MIIFISFLCLCALALLWIPVPHFYRKVDERKLERIARSNRAISLTYDDGPGEHLTQQLLRLLDDYDAKATFFLLGVKISQNNIIELLATKGHEIECHGYGHLNAWYSSPIKTWQDIDQALHIFQDIGLNCRLILPLGK